MELVILIVLALLLVVAMIWLCLEVEQTKTNAINKVTLLEHTLNLMKAKLAQLEKERNVKPDEVAELKKKIEHLESKMTHLNVSMNRFAPALEPLTEDKEYKSITISGIIR